MPTLPTRNLLRHYYEWYGCLNMVSLPEIKMVGWQKCLKPPDFFAKYRWHLQLSAPPSVVTACLAAPWWSTWRCQIKAKLQRNHKHTSTSTIHDSSARSHRQIIWPLLFISIHQHQQAPVMIYCQRCKLGMERRETEANGKWWLKTGQKIENKQVITAGGQGGTKNINASALLAEMSICSFILRV